MHIAQKMVRDFHKAIDHEISPASPQFRNPRLSARLIIEEAFETAEAHLGTVEARALIEAELTRLEKRNKPPSIVEAIDGICDVIVTAYGAAERLGIDLDPFYESVMRSNMAKTLGAKDSTGKVQKPVGWQPPDIEALLKRSKDKTVIGIAGRAGSGKSTCAEHLIREYGAKRISFADPLKDLAIKLMDFTQGQVRGSQAQKETVDPRYGFSARDFLIKLGDEARNVVDPDLWLRTCINRINAAEPGLYVVDDVRYANEAATLAAGGTSWRGFVIRLSRPDASMIPTESSVDLIDRKDICAEIHAPFSPNAKFLLDTFVSVIKQQLGV